jgi:transposase-like protein
MKEELLKGLTDEQIAKIKACKNQEEVLNLAKEEGIELTEEQLAAVSGGCGASSNVQCPSCGSKNIYFCGQNLCSEKEYKCNDCDKRFWHY